MDKEFAAKESDKGTWRDMSIITNDKSLSIYIFGENKQKAYECANGLFGPEIEGGVWKKTFDGHEIYGYPRWPDCEVVNKPRSPIYGFYFNMIFSKDYDFEENTQIDDKAYTFQRNSCGIPDDNKFMTREMEEYLSFLTNNDNIEENPKFTMRIFENVLNLHKKILEKYDEINDNLRIDSQELVKLLNLEECSDDEKQQAECDCGDFCEEEVSFQRFRCWYLLRKSYTDSG